MAARYSVVLITVPDRPAGEKLVEILLNARLAACVGLVPGVRSRYWWKGKIETAEECLLMAKTKAALLPELVEIVRKNHPYSTPEILGLPVLHGNPAYLDWLGAATRFTKPLSAAAPKTSRQEP